MVTSCVGAATCARMAGPSHQPLQDDPKFRSWNSRHTMEASKLKGKYLDVIRRMLKVAFFPDPDADITAVLHPDTSSEDDFTWCVGVRGANVGTTVWNVSRQDCLQAEGQSPHVCHMGMCVHACHAGRCPPMACTSVRHCARLLALMLL